MKVLFTFGGLPHYNNYILSRLNSIENLEIVVAVPQKGTKTIGNSVEQTSDGINFRLIYLEEKKAFYGNYYLSGLLDALKKEKPDVIVVIWPYILNFIVNFKLRRYLKKNNIKLIIKEIPFDVPPKHKVFSYYKSDYALRLNEDLEKRTKVNFLFYLKHLLLKWARVYYYTQIVDATVNYIDDAYEISTSYGLKKEKIFISTNSPDTERLFDDFQKIKDEQLILKKNPYRLIHVGRLVKWKKVDQIIEAVKILENEFPEIELIIIGKGKEEENLKRIALEKNISDRVKFVGGIYNNQDLGRYFKASSIYILAGMGGLSINEAMAFGKPVICSIADGTEKRLVKENINGFYFKSDDIVDLVAKIRILFNDQQLIEKFGSNSLQIIKNEVNIHTVIKGYVDAFNYVSNGKFKLEYNPNLEEL
jgi:glycosyltransferase involved in cell wall biosynthesis